MDFELPEDILSKLGELDAFIEREIRPLEDEHSQFFDYRREHTRTNWDDDGRPRAAWRALILEMERRADRAGHFRLGLPHSAGGGSASELMTAAIREHLAAKGPGLHNDLHDDASIVANLPIVHVLDRYGTAEQKTHIEPLISGSQNISIAFTEPSHGNDKAWIETTAERDDDHWIINGRKRWNSRADRSFANLVFARTAEDNGSENGITAFLVPMHILGHYVLHNRWTFNMPSDHADTLLSGARVPSSAILGGEGNGLEIGRWLLRYNKMKQAAASIGAARFCITESVKYARERMTFGAPLSTRQGVQFPLVELHAEYQVLKTFLFKLASALDHAEASQMPERIAICNYRANRLACEAADRAIQIHGAKGYSRELPFEYIYRHHRRYRITDGSEEVQIQEIGDRLFQPETKRPH